MKSSLPTATPASLVVLVAALTGCGGGSMSGLPGTPAVTLSANSLTFPNEVVGAASAAQDRESVV